MYYPRLRDLREDKDLTQEQLVQILGMHKTTYTNYEQGKREPNGDKMVTIANLFNVTTDYLLGREPAPNPFADLNLSEEDEANVVAKYMSLPPEIRACMLDVLVQLGDAEKKRKPEPDPDDTDFITVSTTLGEIEDRRKEDANSKDGA